jgi:hypothetical protein
MYGSYYSSDGYKFDDENSRNAYEFYSEDNAFCFASTYGGYKEDNSGGSTYSYEDDYEPVPCRRTVKNKTITCKKKHETKKAVLYTDSKGDFWCPKSISTYKDDKLIVKDFFKPSYIKQDTFKDES